MKWVVRTGVYSDKKQYVVFRFVLIKTRQILYKQGGLISVTSRILVVDMLQSDIPINLVTGMVVLHAERPVGSLRC